MESKKNINGMDYVLAGDYYIPDLKLPNEERPIGKYGRMYLESVSYTHLTLPTIRLV